ncbi:MAG: serine/threonine protein kinase, partial [Planctomycetes bacterium]|nr:serine/threonine protein kinase [Planctomycetota bacterium]
MPAGQDFGNDPAAEVFLDVFDLPAAQREARLATVPPEVAEEVRQLMRFGAETLAYVRSGALEWRHLRRVDPAMIGRRLGSYRLDALIGMGGHGAVYRATRIDFEQTVAIKVLQSTTLDLVARFRRERQVLASLGGHPNIVGLIDGQVDADGTSYIAMEFVAGESIVHHCDDAGLGPTERIGLVREVCSAVQYAHDRGVWHRDLKPDNIRVQDSRAMLLDFGIAKVLEHGSVPSGPWVTGDETSPFTPLYASPEQLAREVFSAASEVYSIGVILFELMVGRLPYELPPRAIFDDVMRAVCTTPPLSVTQAAAAATAETAARRGLTVDALRRWAAGDLSLIVAKALRKAPEERYQSPQLLHDDLGRLLANQPVLAAAPSWPYRARKFLRRHPIAAAVGALVTSLLMMLVYGAQRVLALQHRLAIIAETEHTIELLDVAENELVVSIEGRRRLDEWYAEATRLSERREDYLALLDELQRNGTPVPENRPWQNKLREEQHN